MKTLVVIVANGNSHRVACDKISVADELHAMKEDGTVLGVFQVGRLIGWYWETSGEVRE